MTKITILAEQTGLDDTSYRAMGHQREAVGPTAGSALDALTRQLDEADTGILIVVQKRQADQFFNAAQQRKLTELLAIRSKADQGSRHLSSQELEELETLVDAELDGAMRRSAAMVRELGL